LNVTARDGSALPRNPFLDLRVREAIDLAIDRKALAEVAMEGLGKPASQMVTPSIFGFNKGLGERKYDPVAARKLLADAGYPNGFKVQFSFTQDRLPGDRQVGTSIAQMLAAVGIDAQANAQPAAVFFPARTRGDYSMSMSGWGTLTGEAHYTLSSLAHSNDKDKKMGAFNVLNYKNPVMDKLTSASGANTWKMQTLCSRKTASACPLWRSGPPGPCRKTKSRSSPVLMKTRWR
jgi:peptide/nickel transport system substrate-binding protein